MISRYDKKLVNGSSFVNRYVIDKNSGKIYREKEVNNPNIKLSTKNLGYIGGNQN
jgi:hypothetical protein